MFEEQLAKKVDICNEIIRDCRNELYLNLRFLDVALHSLALQPSMELGRTATDGEILRYNPEFLMEHYRSSFGIWRVTSQWNQSSTACLAAALELRQSLTAEQCIRGLKKSFRCSMGRGYSGLFKMPGPIFVSWRV